jgi:large subunit ribosomal protein L18
MINQASRQRRHRKIRAKVQGTKERPRLVVFRSSAHFYSQMIDDDQGKVLASASDLSLKKGTKLEKAAQVGKEITKKAKEKGIEKVVFDRAGYYYHGRVKAFAEAVREADLKF